MADLKPCPFCGGTDAYIASNCYGQFYVRCPGCGAVVWGKDDEDIRTEKKIAKFWNRRAESEELKFTRQFIHEHGLEFALASAWNRRAEDGK